MESLKDIDWCLRMEVIDNVHKIRQLLGRFQGKVSFKTVNMYRQINAILNSIDRLEVRGRDSAGISLMCILSEKEYARFNQMADQNRLADVIASRMNQTTLMNQGISINNINNQSAEGSGNRVAITLVYKIAAEIGALGDNIRFIRDQIEQDPVLHLVAGLDDIAYTVSSHTRWASVGEISQPNCHPVDNRTPDAISSRNSTIHICLNGDIDNYQELKEEYEKTRRENQCRYYHGHQNYSDPD